MKVNMSTLTPLWTGGIEKNSDRIHAPGIMGSLRWWYEGIIRGLGGYACNGHKSGDSLPSCSFDPKGDFQSQIKKICPVCRLFGCTGWRRQFKLDISGLDGIPLFFWSSSKVYPMAGNWLWRIFGGQATGGTKSGRGQNVKFTFGVNTLWGKNGLIRVIRLSDKEQYLFEKLSLLFSMIDKWGSLAAKSQNGFGVVRFSNLDKESIRLGISSIRSDIKNSIRTNNNKACFSFRDFFSNTYEIPSIQEYLKKGRTIGREADYLRFNNDFIPCAFDVRYKSSVKNPFTGMGQDFGMRPWFKDHGFDRKRVDFIFGTAKPETDEQRSAGKIGVSHLYREKKEDLFHLRVWGYLPENNEEDRIDIEANINQFIYKMFPEARKIKTFDFNREL